jgi:hypothetical protein
MVEKIFQIYNVFSVRFHYNACAVDALAYHCPLASNFMLDRTSFSCYIFLWLQALGSEFIFKSAHYHGVFSYERMTVSFLFFLGSALNVVPSGQNKEADCREYSVCYASSCGTC